MYINFCCFYIILLDTKAAYLCCISSFRSPFKSGSALASRLCKAAMLYRFKLVANEAKRPDLLATSSYREAKVNYLIILLCFLPVCKFLNINLEHLKVKRVTTAK